MRTFSKNQKCEWNLVISAPLSSYRAPTPSVSLGNVKFIQFPIFMIVERFRVVAWNDGDLRNWKQVLAQISVNEERENDQSFFSNLTLADCPSLSIVKK